MHACERAGVPDLQDEVTGRLDPRQPVGASPAGIAISGTAAASRRACDSLASTITPA
jgi:hypothetical protein